MDFFTRLFARFFGGQATVTATLRQLEGMGPRLETAIDQLHNEMHAKRAQIAQIQTEVRVLDNTSARAERIQARLTDLLS